MTICWLDGGCVRGVRTCKDECRNTPGGALREIERLRTALARYDHAAEELKRLRVLAEAAQKLADTHFGDINPAVDQAPVRAAFFKALEMVLYRDTGEKSDEG